MNLTCHCPSCGSNYQVGEEYAGRRIKCPKCSAAILVAAAAKPKEPPPKRPAAPSATLSPAHPVSDEIHIPGLEEPAPRRATAAHHPKKKKAAGGNRVWLAVGLGAGGIILAAGLVLALILTTMSRSPQAGKETSGKQNEKAAPAKPTPPPNTPMLVLEWPENERSGAAVYIDGEEQKLPSSGPVKYPLRPQPGHRYAFRLTRPGHQPIEFGRVSADTEDPLPFTVQWTALLPGLDDWVQDFEKARKTRKRVLVFFDADWNTACRQLIRDVFSKQEFQDRVAKEYVLVHVDFSTAGEAKAKIEDAARNKRLAEQFGVKEYPVVLVFDSEGRAIGIHEGPHLGGLPTFVEMINKWHETGTELAKLLAAIDGAAAGEPKRAAIVKTLDLLEARDLDRFYQPQVQQWLAALPAAERNRTKPVTPAEASKWIARFSQAEEKPQEAAQVAAEFDQWKKTRKFTNPDMGAGLHLAAAMVLAKTHHIPEALAECKEGLTYEPRNENIRNYLEGLQDFLAQSGSGNDRLAGIGTGFCIAPGGYVLTNHHVIKDAKKLKIRIAGREEPVPGKLIASDRKGDIALVKVEMPEGQVLPPAAVVPTVKAGEKVCCLGFPDKGKRGSAVLKSNVTVTQGIVSDVPDPSDREGRIEIDCRVNPGNSGGPLCNRHGAIIGMVQAKSLSDATRDSFGFVIPVGNLQRFLQTNLPDPKAVVAAQVSAEPLEWEQVRERLEKSVVCILNYQ